MFNKIKQYINNFLKNDPLHNCKLYLDKSCAHVDGLLCDYPFCQMNKEYEIYLDLKEYMKNLRNGIAVENEAQISQYYKLKEKFENEKTYL